MEDFKLVLWINIKKIFVIELRVFFDSILLMCSLLGIVYYFIFKEILFNYN